MKAIVYESSSKGGCYEYAQYLYKNLKQQGDSTLFVLPHNTVLSLPVDQKELHFILFDDKHIYKSKIRSKLSFLFRQFFNPIRFLFFLFRKDRSIVIWNDFEQLTAPVWTVLLPLFASRHYHVIILHDPDRDQYPPSKSYSEWCMKLIMNRMNLALYHGYLPEKKYYTETNTVYKSIVHGVYSKKAEDPILTDFLIKQKKNSYLLGVLGNIREEKNYRLIIEALKSLPDVKLLIAGAPSNSSMEMEELKEFAKQFGVEDRIIWCIRYLSDTELASCIMVCDVLALYYKKQFTSQSGILNLLAPYKKQFIYSNAPSGLSEVCKTYNIGFSCLSDSCKDFILSLQTAMNEEQIQTKGWELYIEDADWLKTVGLIKKEFNAFQK